MSWQGALRSQVGYVDAVEVAVAGLRLLGLFVDDEALKSDEPDDYTHQLLASYAESRDYQKKGIDFIIARGPSGALLADDMSCVDGEAIVNINRAGIGFSLTLAALHFKFHGGATASNGGRWRPEIPTRIRSMCGDELRLHDVVDVLDKGVQPVVKLTLRSGKTLRLTRDHRDRDPDWFRTRRSCP